MMPGTPSQKQPMDEKVKEAMFGLLQFKKRDRWSMDKLCESDWLKSVPSGVAGDWMKAPESKKDASRVSLQLYQSSQPMPTALAVTITSRNHTHIINQSVGSLKFGEDIQVTVLLIKQANGAFNKVPGASTLINRGDWMYFGVPQGEGFPDSVDGLEAKLRGSGSVKAQVSRSQSSGRFRPLSKKEVIEAGSLVEFSVEFDCFKFPEYIGSNVPIGPDGLDLRRRFSINLVGIERRVGEETTVQWFPNGSSVVNPGELGLVMREPKADGSSGPTLTDKDLEPLMKKELFTAGGQ